MPSFTTNDRLAAALTDGDHLGQFMRVGSGRDRFRDEFFGFDTTNIWDLIQTGAGMTISLAGATSGARYLNIATGTTNNAETIIQSKQSFYMPMKLAFGLSMSQRIANQEVFVELVSVTEAGAVEVDSTFASTNLNNALNAASLKFDGTTVTNALHITRGFGVSELASSSTAYLTTAATGTGPNFLPAALFEIAVDSEEVVFGARLIDATSAFTLGGKRTQTIPDPMKPYKIRLRVRNLTGAASTTDVRFHFLRLLDTTRMVIDLSRYMGRTTDVADSLPVAVTSSTGLTATVTATPGVPATVYSLNSAATTNGALIIAGTSGVSSLFASNQVATDAWIKLYNKATAPTVGTDVPTMVIRVPASGQVELSPGFMSYRFPLGLGIAITGAAADADTTAVAAGQVKVLLSRTA